MELEFARTLKELLCRHGSPSLHYITAELQPFSNQQRPDIVFLPHRGGYANHIVFIEIKLTTKPIIAARDFANLVERKTFAEEALERPIARYAFVTTQAVPEFSGHLLKSQGVLVFDGIATPEDVVDKLQQEGLCLMTNGPGDPNIR